MTPTENILGIDPGPEQSAYVRLFDGIPCEHGWIPNDELLRMLPWPDRTHLAIETMHPRGEPVSGQAMIAQLWAGRFIQAAGVPFTCVDERDARFAASGNPKATSAHVRIGLLNIFGEDKQRPCDCNDGRVPGKRDGTTKICPRCKGDKCITVPGPLASFGEHERSALAVALHVWQKRGLTVPGAKQCDWPTREAAESFARSVAAREQPAPAAAGELPITERRLAIHGAASLARFSNWDGVPPELSKAMCRKAVEIRDKLDALKLHPQEQGEVEWVDPIDPQGSGRTAEQQLAAVTRERDEAMASTHGPLIPGDGHHIYGMQGMCHCVNCVETHLRTVDSQLAATREQLAEAREAMRSLEQELRREAKDMELDMSISAEDHTPSTLAASRAGVGLLTEAASPPSIPPTVNTLLRSRHMPDRIGIKRGPYKASARSKVAVSLALQALGFSEENANLRAAAMSKQRRWQILREAAGLCIKCGKRPNDAGKLCKKCRRAERQSQLRACRVT